MSIGADTKANARGGALERGHGALLECLAQLGDALGGVGADPPLVDAAELVAVQTAMQRMVSTGADRSEHSRAVAYLRVVICVSLRMAASAEAPSALMSLCAILQARGRMGTVRQ